MYSVAAPVHDGTRVALIQRVVASCIKHWLLLSASVVNRNIEAEKEARGAGANFYGEMQKMSEFLNFLPCLAEKPGNG